MEIPRWLAACLVLALLVGAPPAPADTKDEASPQQQAVDQLRRFATNIQFNKDGSVRLVRLSKPAVTDEHLAHLQQFPQLDYLAVVCPQVSDAGLANIAGLTNLDTLLLSRSGLSDAGLAHVVALDKLERLYLADTNIGDSGLAHLAGLANLQSLSLERTAVSDAGLPQLRGLAQLTTLLLSDTAVSDAGLEQLGALDKLRLLYLAGCSLNGAGLSHLKSLPDLEQLSLTRTGVGDDAVAALGALTQLKQLELYQTRITAAGLARLRQALPETTIHVDPHLAVAAKGPDAVAPDAAAAACAPPPGEVLPPIFARLAAGDEVPDFQRHVIPLLGRLGCNGRACHGSFQGQGGFRLSMFGYDFAIDHENLSERIDLESPDQSLILNKPTSADDHEGGLRLPPGGCEQQLLRRWIEGGARSVDDDAPRFARLEVTPAEIVFAAPGETAQLRAVAVWSDGTREDVTPLTRFVSNDPLVAEVEADGRIRAAGRGATHVISFYDNGTVASEVMLPLTDLVGDRYPDLPAPTRIDELVVAKLRKLGITPSPLCSDEEFLRRASLDIIGTLPTPEEIERFVADEEADKRARKVDELLERPAYVTWWTTRLCDLTGSNAGYLGGTEMAQPVAAQWRAWIERRVSENVGWDRIVAGILLARSRRPGQPYADFVVEQSEFTRREQPADVAALERSLPHFWFRSNIAQPTEKALAFGYTFLGVRLDCAQCHKHPYDQWSQRDFELFTEFFTRVKAGAAPDAAALHEQLRNMLGVPVKLNTAALRRQSYLRIAAEGLPIPWKEVYVEAPGQETQPAKLLGGETLDLSRFEDPRQPLMDWLLAESHHYLAKAFVNRIWANYFHVGIVDPPDDLNRANPPSNAALLDYLAAAFIESGYDMKWLHRTIATSRTYQLSWRPNATNRQDERHYSRAVLRRLPAEVAVDAILQATAADAPLARLASHTEGRKIGQHPRSYQARAIDFSLLIFGKPLRTTNCDCERKNEPTLLQALYVRNDQELLDALDRKDGWLAELQKRQAQLPQQIDELIRAAYLRSLSRLPDDAELADCRQHLADSENVIDGVRDLMWALLNTQEFITNH